MIRLLIVDDSPLVRLLLTDLFRGAGDFTVAVARSGEEALAALPVFRPNVVTLDITMPGMSGLACLDRIMVERPCPVVMVSALTTEGAEETVEAMALGAVAFVPKPRGALSLELPAAAEEMVSTVRAAAGVRLSRTTRLAERVRLHRARALAGHPTDPVPRPAPPQGRPVQGGLVLIGCSTGGPPALDAILPALPAGFASPIVIAQHMPASFTGPLARRLDRICAIGVEELTGPTILQPRRAYIARGDGDVLISRRQGAVAAMPAPGSPDHHWHPSVDRMVASALGIVAPERLVGVLLTGMGTDGVAAMTELKAKGGRTVAEAEETAVIWGMPGALVRGGGADFVTPLDGIARLLATLAG
ncbi:chemotaxis-specific protein-glutamate methyltransferase CheB [uncultured Sphingomonas sp.]|uniref:chemotaxis-specific protein-glutamate methyltransferase CheB n=1 Tax=uncultured Sphingomonas sp. TaxID=158754 RepID=UPI0025CCA5DC|nr:chemotaxis-specific protein-glutamate methyltransferase CheB [uncultured Sphingomonas sp.]